MDNLFPRYYAVNENGRVWGALEQAWVDGQDGRPDLIAVADVEVLRGALRYYGYGLGELASPEEMLKQFEEAVSARLDSFAQEKQYDNMDKARLASLSADFKTDGDYANGVYDQVWLAAFALEEQIRGGSLSAAEALSRLPAVEW